MSNWTFQQQFANEIALVSAASDHGTTIALFVTSIVTSDIWRSTDGGVTWAKKLSNGSSGGSLGQVAYAGTVGGNKTWYALGVSAGISYVSSDDGQTWSSFADSLAGGAGSSAFDSNGTIINAPSAVDAHVEATVNGTHPFTSFSTPAAWAQAVSGGMLWDGSNFVAVTRDSGPTNYSVYTAPTGFTIGAGPTWTQAGTGTANHFTVSGGNGKIGSLAFVSAVGYAAICQSGANPQIAVASTPGGLTTATLQQMTMDSGSANTFLCGADQYFFWGNNAGNIWRSADGSTWQQDTLSQAFATGEKGAAVIVDAVNSHYILFGNLGSVYTGPALTTVPNVVGDTQTVATLAITSAGLTLGPISSGYSNTIKAGLVLAQIPTAGSSVSPGSPVAITLSLGPQFATVPNVIGDTAAVANSAIIGANLVPGIISGVLSPSIPIGDVATQNPVAGTLVKLGTPVNLGISFIVPEFNVDATVISQYANSPIILDLVETFGQYFDPATNLQDFYLTVWNIDTASGFGLDIWGIILGVSRVIPIPGSSGSFGFENADVPPDWQDFGNLNQPTAGGPFFGGQIVGNSYKLSDGAYRTLLLTKALANICATTGPGLNALITNLFPGRGRCYTQDRGAMTMAYVFEFPLTSIENAILSFSGVLAHPAGVGVNIIVLASGLFGFHESGAGVQPFNFGAFH